MAPLPALKQALLTRPWLTTTELAQLHRLLARTPIITPDEARAQIITQAKTRTTHLQPPPPPPNPEAQEKATRRAQLNRAVRIARIKGKHLVSK
jgi:hypothetical protein